MSPRVRILAALWRIAVLLARLALPWVVTAAGVGAVAYLIAGTLIERGVPPMLLSLGAAQVATGVLLFRVWRHDVRLRRLESGNPPGTMPEPSPNGSGTVPRPIPNGSAGDSGGWQTCSPSMASCWQTDSKCHPAGVTRDVTRNAPRDVTKRDSPSRPVTTGHAASHHDAWCER